MSSPKLLQSGCVVSTLLLMAAGCASVGNRQRAPEVPQDRVAQRIDGRGIDGRTVGGAEVAADVTSPQALDAPTVHPVAYTRPAELVYAAEPLQAMDGNLIGSMMDAQPALTLAEIEQFALANNPSLTSAGATSSKAAGLLNQVGTRPNPTVGYLGNQIADEGTDQHVVFVEQEFVRGRKLQLNQEVLRHTLSAQRWETEVQRHRVLTDVRVRFFEAAAAQLQLEAIDEFARVASRGVQVAADRLQAEEASKVDLLQARIMSSEINLSRQQTEAAYRGAWKDLAAISGMSDAQPLQLEGAFSTPGAPLDWESTYSDLLAQSPELTVARELVCEKQANHRRQKAQPTPNVTAGFGAGYDAATDSGLINLLVGAPIPVKNRNSGNIAAAYADYVRAAENVKRIELAIRARLARVAQDYDSSMAAVQKYEQEILPQAQESLTLSEEAYAAGQLEFLQVLVVRRRYFDSKLAFIQAQSHFAQAEAKIRGLLLTGGLDAPRDYTSGDGLRDQSFGGQ